MSIMKRATQKLQQEGLPDLEVHKGMYGYSVRNKKADKQRCLVFKSAGEAVTATLHGVLPDVISWR